MTQNLISLELTEDLPQLDAALDTVERVLDVAAVLAVIVDHVEDLRERYTAVEGAWHFNKKYWNTIYLDRDMPDSEIKHWIHHSYREVIAKLPKKL